MQKMNFKERLTTVFKGNIPDRIPICETSIWDSTLDRWHKEGLPNNSYEDYFGLDKIGIIYFDGSFGFKKEVIKEKDEYVLEKDEFGATIKRWKNHYAPPSHLDYSIKTMRDWLSAKERLRVSKDRIKAKDRENYKRYKKEDTFTVISPLEPVWFVLQHVLGFERTLSAMIEDINLVDDMLATYTDFVINMCKLCKEEGMVFDGLWFFSDLCYKNGMLFSLKAYKEIIMPYHKKIAEFCKMNNWPLILHCDGDVREFIPLLIEAGFDCIQPLEARCGNDVRKLKKLYGKKIIFFGNISTDIMSRTKREIEEEVRTKIQIAKEGGGYIYHSDHSVPPTVSLENYRYTIELVESLAEY